MKFTEIQEDNTDFVVRGQFENDKFKTPEYEQELYMLSQIHQRVINNSREADPDISWQLEFNTTDKHDGRFPFFAQMRDWWPISKRQSGCLLITKQLGGTSTMHPDELNNEKRHIIFLTEWQPGQAWFIKEHTYTGWKIGTVLDLDFTKLHGNCNSSHSPMTFMQVTVQNKAIIT